MSKYNILFCDDEKSFLEKYEDIFFQDNSINERINEKWFSRSLNKNIGEFWSVRNIIEECEKHDAIIDIAILDINFKDIDGEEDLESFEGFDETYNLEDLGVVISRYLLEKYPSISIVFVSGSPSHVKKTYKLFDSNIEFLNKGGNLSENIKTKISEIIDKKQPKTNLIEKSIYLYDIDYINESNNKHNFKLTNPKISNGKETLSLDISLSKTPFLTLSQLVLLSCYDEKNNKIELAPKGVESDNLKEKLDKVEEKIERISETKEKFLNEMFNQFMGHQLPACGFKIDKAKKLRYGYEKYSNAKNEKCYKTCDKLLDLDICPMSLHVTYEEIKSTDITKKINFLRTSFKDEINSKLQQINIQNFKWLDGSEVEKSCDCKADNLTSIKNCKNPFCTYSLIFSEKTSTGGAYTKYRLLCKPKENFIKNIKEIIKEN